MTETEQKKILEKVSSKTNEKIEETKKEPVKKEKEEAQKKETQEKTKELKKEIPAENKKEIKEKPVEKKEEKKKEEIKKEFEEMKEKATEDEETEPSKKKKKKAKRSKKYGMMIKSKKKRAIGRAVIKTGTGKITLNKRKIEFVQPYYVKEMILEPIKLAGDLIKETDIKINVKGGGFMGQAVTARSAIAKAIVEYTNDKKLKEKYIKYDRLLMVDDHRRVEPKKPLGTKARKKKQSSKR